MTMYQDEPNQVYLTIKDSSGSAERWVVGKTLDEAITMIETAFGMADTAKPAKSRKPRRTKAEMTAQSVIDSVPQKKEKAGAWTD